MLFEKYNCLDEELHHAAAVGSQIRLPAAPAGNITNYHDYVCKLSVKLVS